jgi:translation initiation factor 2 subunit 2
MSDYEELLNRAIDHYPLALKLKGSLCLAYSIIRETEPLSRISGNSHAMNRDLSTYSNLVKGTGTAGNLEGNRAIMQGKFTHYLINDRLDDYVQRFIMCHECNRPDTRIIREDRISSSNARLAVLRLL